MHRRCLPRRSLPARRTRTFSFSFFFYWRQTLVALFWLSIIQTNIFPLAWDRLFLLNVALAELMLKSRRLTRSDCERLATPAKVKVAQIWTFSSANVGRAHHQHWQCLSSKLEKKHSFKAILGKESDSEKYRKQCLLHDQTAGMPRTSCPGRNKTIGLLNLTCWLCIKVRLRREIDVSPKSVVQHTGPEQQHALAS